MTDPRTTKLDVLATLIEVQRWPRRDRTPVKILRDALADMGRTQTGLGALLNSRSTVSELLCGKHRISLAAAQAFGAAWRIPILLLAGPCTLAA